MKEVSCPTCGSPAPSGPRTIAGGRSLSQPAAPSVRLNPGALERIEAFMAALEPTVRGEEIPEHPEETLVVIRECLETMLDGQWQAARDFERRQWSLPVDIPNDPRAAHANGLFQALEIVERSKTLAEAREAIMAVRIYIAPAHLRPSRKRGET